MIHVRIMDAYEERMNYGDVHLLDPEGWTRCWPRDVVDRFVSVDEPASCPWCIAGAIIG